MCDLQTKETPKSTTTFYPRKYTFSLKKLTQDEKKTDF